MSHPYGTLTGLDYSGMKKKIMAPETSVSTGKIQLRTKYEKYSEKPHVEAKKDELPKVREKTDEMTAPKTDTGITPIKMFVAFFALACLMIVWIWETNYVREGLLEIEKLKDEKLEIEKTNESIQVDITKLSDYQRIEKIASEKLKMVPAKKKPGVIFIDPEKVKSLGESQKTYKER